MTRRVQVQEAFKLALSMMLLFWLALEMDWDMPKYGALTMVIISLGTSGASLRKGILRIVGTTGGLMVGLFVIAALFQHQWLTLGFLSLYFLMIGYFVQFSTYSYAWVVAGALPAMVWASVSGHMDPDAHAFHYAVFRYLETTAGVVIYTLVCSLVWPQKAGEQLISLGEGFWNDVHAIFNALRGRLKGDPKNLQTGTLETSLTGSLTQMLGTLQAAYADTPAIRNHKKHWELVSLNLRVLVDALDLWRQTIVDCGDFPLEKLLPGLSKHLDRMDGRFKRISALWSRDLLQTKALEETDDASLLKKRPMVIRKSEISGLSHFDRAAFMNFLQQLKILDQVTRNLLQTLRIIKGLELNRVPVASSLPPDLYKPSAWNSQRLLQAIFPVLCFVSAYFFWFYTDPPGGQTIAVMAFSLSLSLLLTPINPISVLVVLTVVLWVVVAPVYFFVMPSLSTGFGLLGLIFIYTFVFAYLGGKSPVLKLVPIALFVMLTGIGNNQSFSFMGIAYPAMALGLGLSIIAGVNMLWTPSRPERLLLGSVQRFFKGCERITAAFAYHNPKTRKKGRKLRKRYAESFILPSARQFQTAQRNLDYKLFPDNDPDKVTLLAAGLQQIFRRLQALSVAFDRVTIQAPDLLENLNPLRKEMRERIQQVFKNWARFKQTDAIENERFAIQKIARDLEIRLDAEEEEKAVDEESAEALYALLGTVKGLLRAMEEIQRTIRQLNWQQWEKARF